MTVAQHTFEVTIEGDPEEAFKQLRQEAKARGVRITGTKDAGRFEGMVINGSYRLEGQVLRVTVQQIPFFVSPATVEAEFRKFFKEGS